MGLGLSHVRAPTESKVSLGFGPSLGVQPGWVPIGATKRTTKRVMGHTLLVGERSLTISTLQSAEPTTQ